MKILTGEQNNAGGRDKENGINIFENYIFKILALEFEGCRRLVVFYLICLMESKLMVTALFGLIPY